MAETQIITPKWGDIEGAMPCERGVPMATSLSHDVTFHPPSQSRCHLGAVEMSHLLPLGKLTPAIIMKKYNLLRNFFLYTGHWFDRAPLCNSFTDHMGNNTSEHRAPRGESQCNTVGKTIS